jgi:hypothetical protein
VTIATQTPERVLSWAPPRSGLRATPGLAGTGLGDPLNARAVVAGFRPAGHAAWVNRCSGRMGWNMDTQSGRSDHAMTSVPADHEVL